MSKFTNMGHALYEGRVSIDFIGRRKDWYAISAAIVLVALYGLLAPSKGLNLGIEFKGGVEYQVSLPADQVNTDSVTKIRDAVAQTAKDDSIDAAKAPVVNTSGPTIRVQTEPLDNDQATVV